jgi:hypothetical protein
VAEELDNFLVKEEIHPSKGGSSPQSAKLQITHLTREQNQFTAKFTQLQKNVANYLQCLASDKGHMVVETVRTGKQQVIALPPAINQLAADVKDQKLICKEAVQANAKQRARLNSALKKGYAALWDQCLQFAASAQQTQSKQRLGARGMQAIAPQNNHQDREDLHGI